MTQDAGAGADGKPDGQGGSGAPSGDPEGSQDGKPDDEFVPVSRFKAALADQARRSQEREDALRAEFEAFKSGAKSSKDQQDQPKRYSRVELKAAVSAGQVTQDQADDIWAKQVKDEAREEAVAAAREDSSRRTQQEQLDHDLNEYKRLAPEIKDRTSDTFEKVRTEFQYMTRNGSPKDLATELAAIRAVLGPLDKLEKAKSATRSEDHDQQGGGGRQDGGGKAGKKLVDTLSPREKEHYDGMIKRGHYKDWGEVEKVLGFARTDVRRRQGARV